MTQCIYACIYACEGGYCGGGGFVVCGEVCVGGGVGVCAYFMTLDNIRQDSKHNTHIICCTIEMTSQIEIIQYPHS